MNRLERALDRHEQLLQAEDRLVVHLAELHAPDRYGPLPVCKGCDHNGYNASDRAHWPCRTWTLLAEEVDR